VKKRDPRYKALIEAAELRKEAQITEAKLKGARERAEFIAKLQDYQEQDWTKIEEEEEEEEDFEDEQDDEYFCVACNKSFKNENAWKNHEKSRKHIKNVELLKEEMFEEDEELISNVEASNLEIEESKFENGASTSQNGHHQDVKLDERNIKDEEEDDSNLFTSKKKNKKQKKKQKTPNWGHADDELKINPSKEKSPKNGVSKETPNEDEERLSELLEKTKITSRGGFESDEDSGTTPYFLKDEDNDQLDQTESSNSKKEKKKKKKKEAVNQVIHHQFVNFLV